MPFKPGMRQSHAWLLKIVLVVVCVCVCVCVHVRVSTPRLLITSGVIWTPYGC